jgi:hypothetical protein
MEKVCNNCSYYNWYYYKNDPRPTNWNFISNIPTRKFCGPGWVSGNKT